MDPCATQQGVRGVSTWFGVTGIRTRSCGNWHCSLSLEYWEPMGTLGCATSSVLRLDWAAVGCINQRLPSLLQLTVLLSKNRLFGNKLLSSLRLWIYVIHILSFICIVEVFQTLSTELLQTRSIVPLFSRMKCEGLLFLKLVDSWINYFFSPVIKALFVFAECNPI